MGCVGSIELGILLEGYSIGVLSIWVGDSVVGSIREK